MSDSIGSVGDGGASFVPAASFAPASFEPCFTSSYSSGAFTSSDSFSSAAFTSDSSSVSFGPVAGYDAPSTPAAIDATPAVVQPEAKVSTADVPTAFKSNESAKYQVNESMRPVDAARPKIADGESPAINVQPKNDSQPADIVIKKDGTVDIAKGLNDGDKPLSQYNVQVEAGADPKVTEKVLDDLGTMIHDKCPNCTPRIDSGKDTNGGDLVSADYRDRFRERYKPADQNNPDEDLPDDPELPDGGGGGGGGCDGGGGGNDLNPDDELGPEQDENVDPGADNSAYRERGFQALKEMSTAMGDMHANHYANWMMAAMLPAELLEELGDPPWSPEKMKKLQEYMKTHGKDIKKNIADRAAALEKQGDTEGAKALNDFGTNMESICNDPAKLEQFSGALANFYDKSAHGEANTTDVHAMFENNSALEAAIRNSQLVETAKKYDSSQGGSPDLEKVKKDNGDKLIAELQRNPTPPKETEIIKFVDLINSNNAKAQAQAKRKS
jgi:hypothetical protein